ncbi:MAG: hypothetical protein OIF35_07570 [Cellvibrionaceae bacterium]|nr:hypothetical protein [Cellvibrionaceae bacterium]MCV6627941.1 hypothetical protein [Cellvibrionaceae bacterium]
MYKISPQIFWLLVITVFITLPARAVTPNDVYFEADKAIASIKALRKAKGLPEKAREPGVQVAKTPLHVYTKTLELYEKIQRYKKSQSLPANTIPDLPSDKVSPAKPYKLLLAINSELNGIVQSKGVSIGAKVNLQYGKTPSDVYENVWRASYLMDDLAGAISPSYVYRNLQRIQQGLLAIGQSMNMNLSVGSAEKLKGNKPADANIEAFKILYKLADLERKIGVKPSRIPTFPAGDISPSDVYDATNNILAELTKINIQKQLPVIAKGSLSSAKITPNEVVAQMLLIQKLLDQLMA